MKKDNKVLNISEKYKELGGEKSFLGKPIHEEKYCPDGIGK